MVHSRGFQHYTSSWTRTPVPFNAPVPAPVFADATGVAPKLRDALKKNFGGEYDGWYIGNGYRWIRNDQPFHPEVMLFDPQAVLERQKDTLNLFC